MKAAGSFRGMTQTQLLRGEHLLEADSVPQSIKLANEARHSAAMKQLEKMLAHAAKATA